MRAALLFVSLAATWLLWSGIFKPQMLLYGALSCALVVAIALRLEIVKREVMPFEIAPRLLVYVPWLAWEIVKSNITTARIVLSPSLPIQPQIFRVPASQQSELAQVIYANSITLTPGTITLDVRNGSLLIHSLSPEFAEGVESGEMDRRVCRIEGRTSASEAAS